MGGIGGMGAVPGPVGMFVNQTAIPPWSKVVEYSGTTLCIWTVLPESEPVDTNEGREMKGQANVMYNKKAVLELNTGNVVHS